MNQIDTMRMKYALNFTNLFQKENTNAKTVEYVLDLTKFVMVLLTVLTMKRMNGHVQKSLPNA